MNGIEKKEMKPYQISIRKRVENLNERYLTNAVKVMHSNCQKEREEIHCRTIIRFRTLVAYHLAEHM